MSKVQEASNILKVGFALSKGPHFDRVYLVAVCKRSSAAVGYASYVKSCNTGRRYPFGRGP